MHITIDSAYPSLEISCNFFMPIIAKRQPLHRPSIQIPPTITAIFIFDVIEDKVQTTGYEFDQVPP